jgi:uncharacterized protein with von Willebrand factor type A (vWA) domain
MIYYFAEPDGEITIEEAPKGWFRKELNPMVFTVRKEAVAHAKRNIKSLIEELQERLKELK